MVRCLDRFSAPQALSSWTHQSGGECALRAALNLPEARVGFCVFDRYRNAMKEVDRQDVQSILDGYGQNGTQKPDRQRKPKNVLSRVGRVVERELRVASPNRGR